MMFQPTAGSMATDNSVSFKEINADFFEKAGRDAVLGPIAKLKELEHKMHQKVNTEVVRYTQGLISRLFDKSRQLTKEFEAAS